METDPRLRDFLRQFLGTFQLITTALAKSINNELMSLTGVNNVTGTINLTNAAAFRIPQVAGDYGAPSVGELWFNTTSHRMRFDTDNVGVQSVGWIRPLAQNAALGNAVGNVAVVLTPNEPDTAYQVVVEPSWNTTVYVPVATKLVGSVQINFGTVTPDALQKVSYCLVR